MKTRNFALATVALALAASPAIAEAAFERVVAPTESESKMVGGASILLAVAAAAAVIGGIIIIADDGNDPVSA